MPKASDLLRQGRGEELWQMCCGFLDLDITEFMEIQERLLLEQLELLNKSQLGRKIMRGVSPKTIDEFRRLVPLTAYQDYCPELSEKKEEMLPAKTGMWVHSSGWSGEFNYKWVPFTGDFIEQLSKVVYGVGMLSCAGYKGDISRIPYDAKLLYSVAPRPYVSGTFADVLRMQTPLEYLPSIEEAEKMLYEERIAAGFQRALNEGLDYFFGLSLVLVKVGEKLRDSSKKIDIRKFIKQPHALWRLTKGLLKSRLAGRSILPKDIWDIKGIIGSGIDSGVYKTKIKELWGKTPLDLYSCTEGGIIATQTWDYQSMTFIPNLNFFEFIPEDELLKWQMDRSYKMKTLLLNEVEAGENYEIVITSLHGGSLMRYRIGDMIKITSLANEKLGIKVPQMSFERRVDNMIDFYVVMLTEKSIWQAIESTGVPYEDWVAFRDPENLTLNIGIELKEGSQADPEKIARLIYDKLTSPEEGKSPDNDYDNDLTDMADFGLKIDILPKGTFTAYTARKQAQGADLAHIKPPHLNPSEEILSLLLADSEETIVVTKSGTRTRNRAENAKISVSS